MKIAQFIDLFPHCWKCKLFLIFYYWEQCHNEHDCNFYVHVCKVCICIYLTFFSFIRCFQVSLQSVCTNFYFYQLYMKIPIFTHPNNKMYKLKFFINIVVQNYIFLFQFKFLLLLEKIEHISFYCYLGFFFLNQLYILFPFFPPIELFVFFLLICGNSL